MGGKGRSRRSHEVYLHHQRPLSRPCYVPMLQPQFECKGMHRIRKDHKWVGMYAVGICLAWDVIRGQLCVVLNTETQYQGIKLKSTNSSIDAREVSEGSHVCKLYFDMDGRIRVLQQES